MASLPESGYVKCMGMGKRGPIEVLVGKNLSK